MTFLHKTQKPRRQMRRRTCPHFRALRGLNLPTLTAHRIDPSRRRGCTRPLSANNLPNRVQPLQRALDLELHLVQILMSANRKNIIATTRWPCNQPLARPHGRASHEATGPPNPPTTAGLRDLWSTQVVVVSGTMATSHEAQTLGEETP